MAGMLLVTVVVVAQEGSVTTTAGKSGDDNVAAAFSETSAAHVNLLSGEATSGIDTGDAATASAGSGGAGASAIPSAPEPVPQPKFVFGGRDDYRWQLGLGVEFFRFQSNIINASLVGVSTTVTYFTNDWFAVEGSLVTGFAPEIYQAEHVKYFAGNGGIRIGGRRARFEPYGHGLVGVAHLQPQTADNSRNALTAQAGGGLDYRVNSRLSLRLEGDWVYTKFFSQNQNNYQGIAGFVFHF